MKPEPHIISITKWGWVVDAYLETRIKHISDEDLFASLKGSLPALKEMHALARQGDEKGAYNAWHRYLKARLAREDRSGWGDADKKAAGKEADMVTTSRTPGAVPDAARIREEADLVVARDIKCWGGVRIQYEGEVDFSRNLGGSSNYGFHYFGWIAPLKTAYLLTGEEKYARTFVEIFMQWYRQRDQVVGDIKSLDVVWYELGCMRARVFRDLYFAFIGAPAADNPEYHQMMLKTILGHGRWLYRHQEAYRAGNWQVFGAQTLCAIGQSFPEFRESGQWLRRGMKWILAHTRRDVYADGCHKERAPHYHLGVVNSFWDVYQVIAGVDAVKKQRDLLGAAIERMLEWTLGASTPSGHSPTVGDSEYDIPQEHFLRVGLARRNRTLVWASQASQEQVSRVVRALGVKEPVAPQPPKWATVDLKSSGFWAVRSGWGREDFYFLVNYGPYGGGHSHAEALAFQMWAKGQPLAVDCGRGISYDDPLHKPWYCSVYAHNAIAVDGQGPDIPGRKGRMLFWTQQGAVDFAGFTHRGYAGLGVAHQRCFLLNRDRQYAVILDVLRSENPHSYEWVLNSPLSLRTRKNGAWAHGLAVVEAGAENLDAQVASAKMALPLKGRSTWGMEREDGAHLRLKKTGGDVRFSVLLAPAAKPGGVQFAVECASARSHNRLVVDVEIDGVREGYRLNCRTGEMEIVK